MTKVPRKGFDPAVKDDYEVMEAFYGFLLRENIRGTLFSDQHRFLSAYEEYFCINRRFSSILFYLINKIATASGTAEIANEGRISNQKRIEALEEKLERISVTFDSPKKP